jgi:FtsP/CotA-like multicopper oxidase with cupredoxin domain
VNDPINEILPDAPSYMTQALGGGAPTLPNHSIFFGDSDLSMNGKTFDMTDLRHSIALNAHQYWSLRSSTASENHPFHMHTNHFVVDDYYDESSGAAAPAVGGWAPSRGQFMDTVGVVRGYETRIRFIPTHFTGDSLAHCHVIQHAE